MTLFLISDTHFGHANMYKFTTHAGGPRVRAKFANVTEGDEFMADMWAQTVKPTDHIYHLGDVARGDASLQIIKKLPGHKRLILGNHDDADMKKYLGVGFQKIYGCKLPLMKQWVCTHIPVHPDSVPKWALGNIHGHIHERVVRHPPSLDIVGHCTGGVPNNRYINVSVEQINYTPIALDDIAARFSK